MPHNVHCHKCIEKERNKEKGIEIDLVDDLDQEIVSNLANELAIKEQLVNDLYARITVKDEELANKDDQLSKRDELLSEANRRLESASTAERSQQRTF